MGRAARAAGGPLAVRPCNYTVNVSGTLTDTVALKVTDNEGPFVCTGLYGFSITSSRAWPVLAVDGRIVTHCDGAPAVQAGFDPSLLYQLEFYGDGIPAPLFLGDSGCIQVSQNNCAVWVMSGFHCEQAVWLELRRQFAELRILSILAPVSGALVAKVETPWRMVVHQDNFNTLMGSELVRLIQYGPNVRYRDESDELTSASGQVANRFGLNALSRTRVLLERGDQVTIALRSNARALLFPLFTMVGAEA